MKKFFFLILALLALAAEAQYQTSSAVTNVPAVTIASSSSKSSLPTSTVGDLGWHGFGYDNGQLVNNPWFGKTKKVDMGEQNQMYSYKCRALIPGTQHVPGVEVITTVNPSHLWETDFHRLVAVYGGLSNPLADKNLVTKQDLSMATLAYIGQRQDEMCALVAKKTLKDILTSPTLDFSKEITEMARLDKTSPFDLKVQTVKVVLPEELLRALALKAM